MITFPRALARRLRTVLTRSILEQEPRGEWPLLVCRAGAHGLLMEARRGDVGVRCHLPGPQPAATLAFRSAALADFEGRSDDPVTLEQTDPAHATAHWTDSGVARALTIETVVPDGVPGLPPEPDQWAALPAAFRQVLADAADTAARDAVRFALTRVQLCGRRGQVIATDGRQLLVRGGFRFPWTDDILVPRLPALGLRELRGEESVQVGRAGDHVVLRLAEWTFFLAIDRTGRFPDALSVVPKPSAVTCRLQLDEEDALLLARALPGLPGGHDEHGPVTLDLGERAVLRADQDGGPPAELELARSVVEGRPAKLRCNRLFLRRALVLGFRELHVPRDGQPAVWRDRHGLYVFVPLDAASPAAAAATATDRRPIPEPPGSREPMSEPHDNGHPNGDAPERGGLEELIAEAEALRRTLLEGAARAGRLAAALRQQRRQSRAVLAAMATLRQLKLDR